MQSKKLVKIILVLGFIINLIILAQLSISSANLSECKHIAPNVTVYPPSQLGQPGEILSYSVNLTNKNSSPCQTANFYITDVNPGTTWVSTIPTQPFSLCNGCNVIFEYELQSPSNVQPGNYPSYIIAYESSQQSNAGVGTATYLV
ncbi:MAG: hypothetical protein AABX23_03995 [Nanoarchaeota archaeon]